MNATQAQKFFEECINTLYLKRDLSRMSDFYATGFTAHPTPPGLPPGLAGLELMTRAWLEAFSDIGLRVESFSVDGDFFTCQLTTTGTHTGSFMGIPATGRKVEFLDRPRYRLENGKIAELWSNPDIQALMTQLGVPSAA